MEYWSNFARNKGCTDAQIMEAYEAFTAAFSHAEARLEAAGGPFMAPASDRVTLVDICWFVNVDRLACCGLDLSRFPRLDAWYTRCKDLSAFAANAGTVPVCHPIGAYRLYQHLTGTTLEKYVAQIKTLSESGAE